jgi:NADPH:quinone reductase-like Zn-dependent oxidoreductase
MLNGYPTSFKALTLQTQTDTHNPVYHDVRIVEGSIPTLRCGEVLVRISAAGFNHREVGLGSGLKEGQMMIHRAYLALDSKGSVPWNRTRQYIRCRWCR